MSGAGTLLAGIGAGAAALAAGPVLGARRAGVAGAAAGVAAGAAAAVMLPVAGAVGAAADVLAGAANTPSAVAASVAGKEWCEETQRYVDYRLDEDAQRVRAVDVSSFSAASGGGGGGGGSSRARRACVERALYDELGVSPDATEAQLKRAYYTKSLALHPDKNKSPDAPDAFQRVCAAYQVLSDPDARLAYDAGGAEAMGGPEVGHKSAVDMFQAVFGSAAFEPLVGRFPMLEQALEPNRDMSAREVAFRQRRRETEVAVALAERLDGARADEEAWCSDQARFATGLLHNSFGLRLLHLIGRSYAAHAREWLAVQSAAGLPDAGASWVGGTLSGGKACLSMVGGAVTAAASGRRAATVADAAERAETVRDEAEAEASLAAAAAAAAWTIAESRSGLERAAAEADAAALEETAAAAQERVAAASEAAARAGEARDAATHDATVDACAMVWGMCVLDVNSTLRSAAHKVLADKSVTYDRRVRRAKALLVLGRICEVTPAAPPTEELTVRFEGGKPLGVEIGPAASGAAEVRSVDARATADGIRVGDVLVAVDGEAVLGYNHAVELAPVLAGGSGCLRAADGPAGGGCDTAGAAGPAGAPSPFPALPPRGLTLTLSRCIAEAQTELNLRQEIAHSLGVASSASRLAAPAAHKPTWAERAGRHGDSEYQFGDVSRSAVKILTSVARSALSAAAKLAPSEPTYPDKAGPLGKRSEYLGQYRVRHFVLRGNLLSWARAEGGAPHGSVRLYGATRVAASDFATGRPFSLTLSELGDRSPLMLACASARERDEWGRALRMAVERGAADEPPTERKGDCGEEDA